MLRDRTSKLQAQASALAGADIHGVAVVLFGAQLGGAQAEALEEHQRDHPHREDPLRSSRLAHGLDFSDDLANRYNQGLQQSAA